MRKRIIPKTLDEWQEAADAAYVVLSIDSCLQYGLMTVEGEWKPDIERCYWVLEEAGKRGIEPKAGN